VIDFGLSSNSTIAEDKAVDLYVLERSFTSAHASCGPLVRPAPGQRRQLHAVLGVCGTAKLSSFSSSKDLVPSVGCCECCGGRRGCRPWLAGCLFVKVDVLTPLCWPPAAKCLALCAQHVARAATVRNCACAVRRRAGILPPALQAVVPHAQQVRGRCATAVSCRPCRSCRWTLLSEHSAAAACHASQP